MSVTHTHTQVSYITSFRGYRSCDTHTHTQVSYITSFRGYRSCDTHTHTGELHYQL